MRTVFRSRILHCLQDPGSQGDAAVEYFEDGVLIVEDDKIVDCCAFSAAQKQGLSLEGVRHLPDKLIVPGFIDTHVHAPQLDVVASYGSQLLQWLEKYTFPAEMRFADPEFATTAMQGFIEQLLSAGTTTAMVFSTSHEQATDALFSAAQNKKMCLIAGKVLMDRNAPPALRDTDITGFEQSRNLIERWHGVDRLAYSVTPRFSITSTPAQLTKAGELMASFSGLYMQTHLSENLDEIATVKQMFPDAEHYLATYDHYGLCSDRSFYAHCVHLEEKEIERLAESGGKVAFCPTSNMFLGSGLFDWAQIDAMGVDISLASDVGAGLSLSMLRTLCDAYKVCQLKGMSLEPMKAFYSITLGNARTLGLEQRIGNLAPGSDADFLILDTHNDQAVKDRASKTNSINEEWFTYMMLGDERLVSETWVAGQKVVDKGMALTAVNPLSENTTSVERQVFDSVSAVTAREVI